MKDKKLPLLLGALVLVSGWSIYQSYTTQKDTDRIRCDLANAFFAEREYVYPALRDIGYEPSDLGKNYANPVTTDSWYYCESK
jgi:hypothetical protein